MDEMEVEDQGSPTGEVTSGSQSGVNTDGGTSDNNPAWNDLLGVIPAELHNQVTPHLQKWDQNFDKVQSQYAPYKDFAESQVPAENISYALNVMQEIEKNPMGIIEALTSYAKENSLWQDPSVAEEDPEGQGQVGDELPDITQHPKFMEMQQLVETIGQQLLQERQTKQEQAEDAQIEDELGTLEEEFGEFDRNWVLQRAVMAADAGENVESLKPFVEQYRQFEQGIIEKSKRPAPRLMPSGGQAPQNTVDVTKMSPAERRQYIVDRLNLSKNS